MRPRRRLLRIANEVRPEQSKPPLDGPPVPPPPHTYGVPRYSRAARTTWPLSPGGVRDEPAPRVRVRERRPSCGDLRDVVLRLAVGRYPAVLLHGTATGVVRGQRQLDRIAGNRRHLLVERAHEVRLRHHRVPDRVRVRLAISVVVLAPGRPGAGHELRRPHRARRRDGGRWPRGGSCSPAGAARRAVGSSRTRCPRDAATARTPPARRRASSPPPAIPNPGASRPSSG